MKKTRHQSFIDELHSQLAAVVLPTNLPQKQNGSTNEDAGKNDMMKKIERQFEELFEDLYDDE